MLLSSGCTRSLFLCAQRQLSLPNHLLALAFSCRWWFSRYMPIMPLVLLNGAEGIGTGWSTSIPNYSPRDVANNLKALLDGAPLTPMQPWYRVRVLCASDSGACQSKC